MRLIVLFFISTNKLKCDFRTWSSDRDSEVAFHSLRVTVYQHGGDIQALPVLASGAALQCGRLVPSTTKT